MNCSDLGYTNEDRCGAMNDGSDYIIGGRKAVPNEFPWMVRISGGCAAAYCAGSLISPRVLLSSYHCTYHSKTKNRNVPCDHSDEKRRANKKKKKKKG